MGSHKFGRPIAIRRMRLLLFSFGARKALVAPDSILLDGEFGGVEVERAYLGGDDLQLARLGVCTSSGGLRQFGLLQPLPSSRLSPSLSSVSEDVLSVFRARLITDPLLWSRLDIILAKPKTSKRFNKSDTVLHFVQHQLNVQLCFKIFQF